nr:hypothetical protein CTI12_AA054220 [Tanacetum cinerariifolium]
MGVVRLLRDSIALENQTYLGRIQANPNTFSSLGLPSPQMTMTMPRVHSEEQESSTTVFPRIQTYLLVLDDIIGDSHIRREKDLSKYSLSLGITKTSSGNALEHFIPNRMKVQGQDRVAV